MVVTITARNAMAATGMSWTRCIALARKHNVPVLHLSARTTAIPAALLMSAIEREARDTTPRDATDELLIQLGVLRR